MKILSSGRIKLRRAGGGAMANWLGTTYAGEVWVGQALIDAMVRQWAVVKEHVETFIKQKPKTTTVKKRAG